MVNNRFFLDLPSGWKETTVYTFEGPVGDGMRHSLMLAIDPAVSEKTDLRDYARRQFGVKEDLPGFALIREGKKTAANGVPAYEMVYKYVPADGIVYLTKQVFMIIGGKGYIFTSAFTENTIETIAAEADRIIESVTQAPAP